MHERWREVEDNELRYWQYFNGLAVLGTVCTHEDGKYVWSARVMLDCRMPDLTASPPTGKALTLEGAKKVVGLLCEVTGTLF